MIKTDLYIQDISNDKDLEYIRVDLFNDEKIDLNSSVQNVNDISKTFSDFSQSFTVPASGTNNTIFQHYYNTDVDGIFNPNIRIRGYIEIGSLPFKFGVIQLEDVKLKNMQPYSYTIRFFSASVNLSDRFGDDDLTSLDFSVYDHDYNASVIDATYSESLGRTMYYPLITSARPYQIGSADSNDITATSGEIVYTDLRPAISLSAIIEAIEAKYLITFDRFFLNRAVFTNLFMWVFNNLETVASESTLMQLDNQGTLATVDTVLNFTTDTITVGANPTRAIAVKIIPQSGFENVFYTMILTDVGGDIIKQSPVVKGTKKITLSIDGNSTEVYKVRIAVTESFEYVPIISVTYFSGGLISGTATQGVNVISNPLNIAANMPKMKITDFITSIIRMFNLVLVPINANSFQLLPLDDWYSQGNIVDITPYINSEDVTFKRPKLFKSILFQHQKSEQILNQQFRNNQGGILGYGDLQGIYQIDGGELKVQTGFENLMFTRLTDVSTGDITNVQVGLSLDKNTEPYIGKPYIFYRCGFQNYDIPLKAKDHADLTYTYLTSTENDFVASQISNSVNYSTDNSTFLFQEIQRNLYFNFWQDYISDLYSTKRRISNWSGNLPVGVIINSNLNDRFIIYDKAYIVNSMRTNLNTGDADLELLNFIGSPVSPPNGVEYESLLVSYASQRFDCKITANEPYTVTKIDTGDGTGWITISRGGELSTNYLIFATNESIVDRSMDIQVTIGADIFTITVTQQQII
jgi:hypothetical protein